MILLSIFLQKINTVRNIQLFGLLFLFFFSACKTEPTLTEELDPTLEEKLTTVSATGNLDYFILPESDDLSAIPQDPKNPLSADKVRLGKMLFHETGLGVNPKKALSAGTYSCASCHSAAAGFQAGTFQGIGEGGIGFGERGEGRAKGARYTGMEVDVQPIRTPSAMNGAYQKNTLWNGQFGATAANLDYGSEFTEGTPKETNKLGYEGLEIQAIAGLGVHRMDVTAELMRDLGYKELFDAVFADDFDEANRYTKETAGLAIAAFERTVMSNQAPFQKWLRGDKSALTTEEKTGAILFFGKAQCAACHTGPALNKEEFHALGMSDLYDCPEEIFNTNPTQSDHLGRGGFTKIEADNYKFKVPQLYNLKDSPFFGHGSSFRSIEDVLAYKNSAIPQNDNVSEDRLAAFFRPLGLTPAEMEDLSKFIENGLYDPNLKRFQPEMVNSGNCIPNNDPLARNQLGCN